MRGSGPTQVDQRVPTPLTPLLLPSIKPASSPYRLRHEPPRTQPAVYYDQGYEIVRGHVAYGFSVFEMTACMAHTD